MAKKNQSRRLTNQHKESKGAKGIFGDEAKYHDMDVSDLSVLAKELLEKDYPQLVFRYRKSVSKKEINESLSQIDPELGQTLFVEDSSIKPDGGIIEVKDDNGNWRIVLVSEAKRQGKDIENIKQGKLVVTKNDQDIMNAGNAIERAHKNISEIANFMLKESYFPYVLFLEGSNFLTKDVVVERPDGRKVSLACNSGAINRIDRLTAANYGMPINKNLCKNKIVQIDDASVMLHAASLFTQGDGRRWSIKDMIKVMMDVAKTSLQMLGRDLFKQLTKSQ
ncbi:MAG: EcoRI family type II restriction endonuclease [Fibrobacter intestinalis]|uniref:Type II restriction enzyme n=2 Tax=Fibrobacter TaxID=832 RepID=A0A1T4R440_9BACT|nr:MULTISPECIES: EcoRI family type II restriction endonuclease [Fibrobacter]PBC74694.1 type II restriction enzyme [Fibrobacter sp. NR9]SKA10713.1 type II restriction enzyme [Fibrobacter intestinalis]